MGRLDDRVAIVTGTSRGIGKAIAELFAAEGAQVACVARTLEEGDHRLEGSLRGTIETIEQAGGTAIAVQANVGSEAGCDAIVEQTVDAFGRVDVLVNNAAMTTYHPLTEFPLRRWKLGFDVNIHAPFYLSQLVLPGMIERGRGAICNISSSASGGPGRGPYAEQERVDAGTMYGASKAALERFTQGLAAELWPHRIAVSALSPSNLVPTPGATASELGPGANLDAVVTEPVDHMAHAALWLVSEPAERVSGRVVHSQPFLVECGVIDHATGGGVERRGSAFSET